MPHRTSTNKDWGKLSGDRNAGYELSEEKATQPPTMCIFHLAGSVLHCSFSFIFSSHTWDKLVFKISQTQYALTLCPIVSMNMETLTFDKKTRTEQKNNRGFVIQNERRYFDFTISGQSLRIILDAENMDLITPFDWRDEIDNGELVKEFTGRKRPDIRSGRLMLYVCPECGGIGCGCISADLEITEDKVIWKNFGYENDYADIDFDSYKEVPSIEFDKVDYFEKFKNLYP